MSIRKLTIQTLIFAVVSGFFMLSGTGLSADDPEPLSDFREDPYDPYRQYYETTLERVRENPRSFTNRHVSVRVLFHKIDDNFSPFFSQFDEENYINFSVWGVNQAIWRKKEMINDFPFFYIDNEHNDVNEILQARKFAIVELKCTVVNVMEGHPFIQVRQADLEYQKTYTDQLLGKLIRARSHYNKGNLDKAEKSYKKVMWEGGDSFPVGAQGKIWKEMARAAFRDDNYRDAMTHAQRALELIDEEDVELKRIRERSWKEINKRLRGEKDDLLKKRILRSARKKKKKKEESSGTGAKEEEERDQEETSNRLQEETRALSKTETGRYMLNHLRRKVENLKKKLRTVERRKKNLRRKNTKLSRKLSRVEQSLEDRKKQVQKIREKLQEQYQKNAKLYARMRNKKKKTAVYGGKSTEPDEGSSPGADDRVLSTAAVYSEVRKITETELREKLRKVRSRNSDLRSSLSGLRKKLQKKDEIISRLRKRVGQKQETEGVLRKRILR